MILLLLMLAASECKATTNIPELKNAISKACEAKCPRGGCITAVDLTGDHTNTRLLLTFADSWGGFRFAGTSNGLTARNVAIQINELMQSVYPMKRFEYAIRDNSSDYDICKFIFIEGGKFPSVGICVEMVN